MNKISKFGISTALACMIGASASASANVAVQNESAYLQDNSKGVYTATINNDGDKKITPYAIIVRYEDGVLVSAACEAVPIEAGLSGEVDLALPGEAITDATEIKAYIIDGDTYSIPVALNIIEKKGSKDLTIKKLTIAGADAQIDNETRTIKAYIPVYDSEGAELSGENDISAQLGSKGGIITVNDSKLSGTDENKNGKIDISKLPTVKLTSEEGETVNYNVEMYRIFEDNFDDKSYISGTTSGSLVDGNLKWSDGVENKLGDIYALEFNTAWKADDAYKQTLAEKLSMGVYPVSDAKAVGGASSMAADTSASPSGNGFKVLKAFGISGKDSYSNYLNINLLKLSGMSTAKNVSVEFDMAYDYNECETSVEIGEVSVSGTIGSTVGGMEFGGGSFRISGSKASMSTDDRAKDKVQIFGTNTTATLDKWNHIKVDVSRTAADATSATLDVYVNGVKVVEGGEYTWANLAYLKFQTSTFRAGAWWLDNLKIAYDVK